MIDKICGEVEYLTNQLTSKDDEMEMQKETLQKKIHEHIAELRKNFNDDLSGKMESLHMQMQEQSEKLTQKIAETIEAITGSPVNLVMDDQVAKDVTFRI